MMNSVIVSRLQIVGIPGCNKILAGELSRLARRALPGIRLARPEKLGTGAVAYPFEPTLAVVACRYHRTSSRVLWDLYESRADNLEALYREVLAAVKADERPWAREQRSFSIRPRNLQRFPAGERQVVGAVKNALVDGVAESGIELTIDADEPDLEVSVRGHDDRVIVSLDLSGARTRRGYRSAGGKAPLRENLAASLLMLARYDARAEQLVDPMAGSGTIAIEAALMARAEPLGIVESNVLRGPVFRDVAAPKSALFADTRPSVIAIELDDAVAEVALGNIERAGVADWVRLISGDFRRISLPAVPEGSRRIIVTNPPYGRRVDNEGGKLLEDFGRWCRSSGAPRVAVIVEDAKFSQYYGARQRVRKPLSNAGLRAYFYLFESR